MEQVEINDIAKETICVLKYFDSSFNSKIPNNFLNLLRQLAQKSSVIIKIDKEKNLKEQDISEECKDLISLMYYSYIATEEEKIEIEKIWNKNEELYQNKIREKYNPNNILKKTNVEEQVQETSNLPIIIQEENFLQKITKFIKRIFNKS